MKRIALLLALISLFAGCKKEVLPEAVTLNKHTLSLEIGETAVLEATVTPANATNPALNWSSTQPSVATVDQEGKVTALSEGQAIITVATLSGGKTDACSVTVTRKSEPGPGPDDSVQSVTVSPSSLELTEGQTAQLSATVSPADASQEVEWASQNTSVATVDDSGLVTAVTKGNARIYARSKSNTDKQGWCEITVNEDPSLKGISFSSDVMTIYVGESRTLTVTFTPEYAANKNVSWSSDNPSIAGVSQEGVVTAVAVGQATITATAQDGGHKASCAVTVTDGNIALVYYLEQTHNIDKYYVNGVEDPRNKVYDYGELKSRVSDISVADCFGKTLYTLERFRKDGIQKVFLCKDRVPMFDIPFGENDSSGYIWALSAQKDYFAILYFDVHRHKLKIFKGDYDGNVTEIPIVGSFQAGHLWGFDMRIAALPDGRIILLAGIVDSFDDHHLAAYTVSQDNTVSERLLNNYSTLIPGLAVSGEGDVYVLTSEGVKEKGYSYRASIYKNWEEFDVWDRGNGPMKCAMAYQGGHIYTAVQENFGDVITIRRDGETIYSLELPQASIGHGNKSLIVTSSGDVYLSVETGNTSAALYKNGEKLYSSDDDRTFRSYCVIE